VFLFYAQPDLRQHIDAYFFDLQTRLKPASSHLGEVIVVPIDDATLAADATPKILSGAALVDIVRKLVASQASAVVLLLPENTLDYSSAAGQEIIQLISGDPRLSLGVLGYHQREPSLRKLPDALVGIKERAFGIDMLRKRSNDVVRRLAYTSYLGLEEQVMLPVAVARHFRSISIDPGASYALNFEPAASFKTVSVADLGTAPAQAALAGNVVILGYTVPVAWPFMTYEQLNANTPLRYDDKSYLHGESLTIVTANAIENLLHDRTLSPLPLPLRLLYVAALVALTLWFWRRGTILGSIGVTVGFGALLYLQSLCMAHFALYFPVADAALFTGLASTMGAWQALQISLRRYADELSRNKRSRDIAEVRSEFLERFAEELSRINQNIGASAKLLTLPEGATPTLLTARRYLQSSSEEFADYIAGVVQVSNLSVADRRPQLSNFDLSKLIGDVAEKFASALDEKDIRVELSTPPDLVVKSNENVVDKILFNFISNAIKYSPRGTILRIAVASDARGVRVHVKDQGPGIAEEHQELIFEKFYRVRNDDTYRVKGTGLGLYLCRYFAGSIGARIQLESTPGSGSDFALVLPR
jgi:signal transduction histidine kinase